MLIQFAKMGQLFSPLLTNYARDLSCIQDAFNRNDVKGLKNQLTRMGGRQHLLKLLEYSDKYGNTALHYAVDAGVEMFDILLMFPEYDYHKLLMVKNKDKETPLHRAIKRYNRDIVERMFKSVHKEHLIKLVNIVDFADDREAVDTILNAMAEDACQHCIMTHLNEAIMYWNSDTNRIMLLRLPYVLMRELLLRPVYEKQQTYLSIAAAGKTKYPDVIEVLLEVSDDESCYEQLCMKDSDGCTPLHLACSSAGSEGAAKAILRRMQKFSDYHTFKILSTRDDHLMSTPLHYVVFNRLAKLVKVMKETLLVDDWERLLLCKNGGNCTPLHLAVVRCDSKMIEELQSSLPCDLWLKMRRENSVNSLPDLFVTKAMTSHIENAVPQGMFNVVGILVSGTD